MKKSIDYLTLGRTMNLHQAKFLTSCAKISQLPLDAGAEVAFVGRSNSGKSSTLNTLCNQKKLAFSSKTPGRTQLINLFDIDGSRRLVDLPGYGYAKVPLSVKRDWQKTLAKYLEIRQCLSGLILITDSRHEPKVSDRELMMWASDYKLPVHVLLNKADKLSRSQQFQALANFKKVMKMFPEELFSCQLFSATSKLGLKELNAIVVDWLKKSPVSD